jgi:pimeloyl-[acyl-carrier protein] methyl ester esterase
MMCVVLPGLDGTGQLLSEFCAALSTGLEIVTVRYPTDRCLSDSELETLIREAFPVSEPFVLLAESYSTPFAITCAASQPANLKGLILCVGFATSPVRGWQRFVVSTSAGLLSHLPVPEWAARYWIIGADGPPSLLATLRAALSSVQPRVLAARLKAVLKFDVRAAVQQIRVPILYVQAKHDRLVGRLCAEELRQLNPRIEVVTLDGPHLLLEREPQKAAAVIINFVRLNCES